MNFLINWSISEFNTQVNPTTCLGDTGRWIQQVTAPTLVLTCWNQQSVCIVPSTCTGARRPPVQLECKMHVHWGIQQVTTRVGAVTCWIQQPVSPKQVVGFSCVFNSEVDQLIRKSLILNPESPLWLPCLPAMLLFPSACLRTPQLCF